MKQFLKVVTVTGADDSIPIDRMVEISRQYPHVEWGILLSKSSVGTPRFPSLGWLVALREAKARNPSLRLSAHLCGAYVKQFCAGDLGEITGILADLGPATGDLGIFDRVQLNFHAIAHKVNVAAMVGAMRRFPRVQFILQLDGVNDHVLGQVRDAGVDAVGLFDLSGGAGVLPESWPVRDCFAGWAGGLSCMNAEAQLALIERCALRGGWIDAETHMRTKDDLMLDPSLVEGFLELTEPWVRKGPKVLHLPADVDPLPEAAVFALFEDAFDEEVYGAARPAQHAMPFRKFQALMVTLDAANQQVGRLRHWVANAGANVKRPDLESRVLFLAASTALDMMMGSPEDFNVARDLMTLAVNEVALSRAGKLDLDMQQWTARESAIQNDKPSLRQLLGRGTYDFSKGPWQNGSVQGALGSGPRPAGAPHGQGIDPGAGPGGEG